MSDGMEGVVCDTTVNNDTQGSIHFAWVVLSGCQLSVNQIAIAKIACPLLGGSRPQGIAPLGIARVKLWSIVLIAYHYTVLRDDGAEPSDGKDNRPV